MEAKIEDLRKLIDDGQKKFSFKKFKTLGPSYELTGVMIFGVALLFLIGLAALKSNVSTENTFFLEVIDLLPLWIFATSAFLISLYINHRNNKRNIAFNMIEELNSEEFLKVRYSLGNQIKAAQDLGVDVDRINGWYPHVSLIDPNIRIEKWETTEDFKGFQENHSLAKMVYFVLRIANYSKHGMIDMTLNKHLFHFFFAHYETLLLEFANAIKRKRHQYNSEFGFNFDNRWELCSERIEYFFQSIGLSGRLPKEYTYVYFPSLNRNEAST